MKPAPEEQESIGPFHGAQNRCFGCGPNNTRGLKLQFNRIPGDGAEFQVECEAVVSDQYEGPPGYLHGGIIATLLDEAMSKANRAAGVTAMTRQMTVEYLRPVPSGKPVRILGRVVRSEGRKHWTEAQIRNVEEATLAHASALFIAVSPMTR